MTESEAKGFIQGKLDCMNKRNVFVCKYSDECDSCQYCYSQGTFREQKEAFQMAINALEKQIPKKPIDCVSDDVCEWKSASDGEFIQNPHTKRLYSNEPSMKNIYCNTCGKKIKVVD